MAYGIRCFKLQFVFSFYDFTLPQSRLTFGENMGKIILTMNKRRDTMDAGGSGNIPGRSSMTPAFVVGAGT